MVERASTVDVQVDPVIDLTDAGPEEVPSRAADPSDSAGPVVGSSSVRARDDRSPSLASAARSRSKRTLDLFLSGAMLLVSLPVALVVAVAIKLDDRGPVFYRQERWGADGLLFRVFKFRTMVADSDRRYGVRQAKHDDDRITRIGRVLRKTGLDELPQLLNILKGEMSFVGPRPLALGELIEEPDGEVIAYEEVPGFVDRLAVRPGLTGLATVHLPKDAHPLVKLRYDQRYIDEWSFATDLKLIVMSFAISFRGRWETRDQKLRRLSGDVEETPQKAE
jgi:lipopolysaccharide/colanic/teichoic acid biosynthesis glycosyltransferase